MGHSAPEFEQKDVLGKTRHFNGSVGLTDILVPSSPGDKISRLIVKNSNTNAFSRQLSVAIDAGTDYFVLQKGEWIEWAPKNNNSNSPIKQIRLLGDAASVYYEIIMDFEP